MTKSAVLSSYIFFEPSFLVNASLILFIFVDRKGYCQQFGINYTSQALVTYISQNQFQKSSEINFTRAKNFIDVQSKTNQKFKVFQIFEENLSCTNHKVTDYGKIT